jgi:hypothetical protein
MIGATLFSELPASVRVRDEPRYEHPRWRVGDRVRPRAEWSDGQTPVIPSGEVTRAEAFGLGQIVKVGSDPRFYVAGCFERDGTA